MKLEPKAKPIRIRIKIGNEEYSTFDSLRENLSLSELYPLFLDGRFVKWLNQIGEKERAERSEKLKAECKKEDDRTRNYILLLSLFDNEVEQALSKYNHSIDAFLSNIQLDKLLSLNGKHGFSITWPHVINTRLSRLNSKERLKEVKRLFKLDEASLFFDYKGWAKEMTKLVKEAGSGMEIQAYKSLFDYLIAYSIEPDAEQRVLGVMWRFYNDLKVDYPLTKVLTTDELSIEYLSTLYSREILKGLDIEWDELFVKCVQQAVKQRNKEEVHKIIEEIKGLTGNNKDLWLSFINRCIKVGIEEARAFKDEWLILANSDEYEIVNTALQDFKKTDFWNTHLSIENLDKEVDIYTFFFITLSKFRINRSSNYLTKIANYGITNSLGKQILSLLLFLIELQYSLEAKDPKLSDDYLNCLKKLMVFVRKYQNAVRSDYFPKEYKDVIEKMKDKDIKLASKLALSIKEYRYAHFDYIDWCKELSVELQDKLQKERREK